MLPPPPHPRFTIFMNEKMTVTIRQFQQLPFFMLSKMMLVTFHINTLNNLKLFHSCFFTRKRAMQLPRLVIIYISRSPFQTAFPNPEDIAERRTVYVVSCHKKGKYFSFPLNSPIRCCYYFKCLIGLKAAYRI